MPSPLDRRSAWRRRACLRVVSSLAALGLLSLGAGRARAEGEGLRPPAVRPGQSDANGPSLPRPVQDDLPPPEVRILKRGRPLERPAPLPPSPPDEDPWAEEGPLPATEGLPEEDAPWDDDAWDDDAWEDDGWEDEAWVDESWEEEDWQDEEQPSRSFLYKELVLSVFFSSEGVRGLPPSDRTRDHFEISPRPPGNYVGLDYVQTFGPSSGPNRILPDWLPLTAIDLHPRLVFDRMEELDDLDVLKFAPQDFWAQFNPGGVDRLSLRIGQFVIPYGVNPILAPRQRFILPLEAHDLGLKWDWGIDLRGPLDEYEWELAATIGSGEGLHGPHLFGDSDRRSYLLSGRIGTPTYWDLQYGFSFLYGDLPVIRGPRVMSPFSISRWRIGLDAAYRHGTYLMAGAQLTYGQDGHGGDKAFVAITGGETANVLGGRLAVDWVVPGLQDLRLGAQFESVIRDLDTSGSDDTALTLEVNYSLSTSVSLMLDYRVDLNRAMGGEDHAFYLTFVYYGQ